MAEKDKKYFEGIGRRKSAVARVRFFPAGPGGMFKVNELDYKEYFDVERLRQSAIAPLKLLDNTLRKNAGVEVHVRGGGIMAQAEAVTLGLARALVKQNEDLKKEMRAFGYLTRDPRKVERKKFGLKKARRAPQWRKR
ncbi:MAG: 30S ribosomal protein S9 [Candidatus Colwellbacteria bacterium CG10_big_fil_rev_8_21_14_0_10_42_22]|uniref:Small ribosomal subunit protein uS9 n=1 Tax=Candidatus Colwellbacteria bacterium CG10_big_fil_rev_8_21_14_0_10_42_22 TaxID=1974540 RepID=A0A2H0VFG3_9BACT|nr:MAG: 30S ribosomal protein S9 [Candidatus Colwellbacteria bacterium CG10_big_fil_rev_8_21_14_0_10_42_22]